MPTAGMSWVTSAISTDFESKIRRSVTDGIVLIDETLKGLEEEFDDRLFRVHRNAIINLDFLDFLETIEGGRYRVRFKGTDETLAVSRRHLPALRKNRKYVDNGVLNTP